MLGINNFNYFPMKDLENISITFENIQGTVSMAYGPTGSPSSFDQAPYINLIVDVNGDLSNIIIFVICTDTLQPILINNCGIFIYNTQTDLYNVSWNSNMCFFAVGVGNTQGYLLGNISPFLSLGSAWTSNIWKFKDFITNCPNARIINYNTLDNGMPIGMKTSGILIISGSAGQQVFSSKILRSFILNDIKII